MSSNADEIVALYDKLRREWTAAADAACIIDAMILPFEAWLEAWGEEEKP